MRERAECHCSMAHHITFIVYHFNTFTYSTPPTSAPIKCWNQQSAQTGLGCKGKHNPLATEGKSDSNLGSDWSSLCNHTALTTETRTLPWGSAGCSVLWERFPCVSTLSLSRGAKIQIADLLTQACIKLRRKEYYKLKYWDLLIRTRQKIEQSPPEDFWEKICWKIVKQYKATSPEFWFYLTLTEEYAWNAENTRSEMDLGFGRLHHTMEVNWQEQGGNKMEQESCWRWGCWKVLFLSEWQVFEFNGP